MRYAITFLVGLLAGCFLALPLQAQALTVAQADSLRLLLRASKADTSRIGTLLRLSDYYQCRTLNYRHNLDTALVLANQAAGLSQQLRYERGQQEALFQQGKIYIKQEKLNKVKKILSSLSGVTHIRLLLELGKNKLRPTYYQEANLDSALWYFGKAEGLSQRLKSQSWQQESQMLTGVAYLFKGDCKSSGAWFRRVIDARQRAGDKAGELRARLQWATAQYSQFKYCENSDTLSRAFALARQLSDRPREALLLLLVGYKNLLEVNPKQVERLALNALSIQKAIGYSALNRAQHALLEDSYYVSQVLVSNLSNAYYLLGDVSAQTNQAYKELFYNLEAVKDIERSSLRNELDWPYFCIGNIYFELGEYAKCSAYYRQSLAVSQQKGRVVVHVALIRRLAESLLKTGQARKALSLLEDFISQRLPLSYENKVSMAVGFGQCYAALGKYELAEQYFLEAVAWSRKEGETMEPYICRYISEFYVTTAQYAKAAPYLKGMDAYVGQLRSIETMQLYLLRFRVDSAQANYSSALRYYQRFTALKDSLLNETTNKQMAELDVRYQIRQKEQTLKLRQKDITLLSQQNKTQQTQRNALIGGTALLSALLGLSYNRYRLKQRSNQLLQAQKVEINQKNEWLSTLLTEKDFLLSQQTQLLGDKDQLLNEKELLLKEIHHRVKNNLQVVMSLLNSQTASLHDPTALSAIQQSQHRVQAMALIHQKLYQTEGVARIPMADYIAELVDYLHESFDLPQLIFFNLQVEPIELDVTQAVPLGLIINEAITNALKYAFPDGRPGRVQVELRQVEGAGYELRIVDDGVGLPADFDPAQSRSLGLTLMRGFSEQLGGQLQISGQSGLTIRLLFRDDVYSANA
ncbi:tetratricopeptide repeat-containing sensor histidine kinase [Spirosoma arcticum]